jgi:hypothetical protein
VYNGLKFQDVVEIWLHHKISGGCFSEMTNINSTPNEDRGMECARLLKEIAEVTNALI